MSLLLIALTLCGQVSVADLYLDQADRDFPCSFYQYAHRLVRIPVEKRRKRWEQIVRDEQLFLRKDFKAFETMTKEWGVL